MEASCIVEETNVDIDVNENSNTVENYRDDEDCRVSVMSSEQEIEEYETAIEENTNISKTGFVDGQIVGRMAKIASIRRICTCKWRPNWTQP